MALPPSGPNSPAPAVLIPTPDPDQWVLSTTHEQNSVKKWPKSGVTLFGQWAGNDVASWKQKIGSTGTPYSTYIFTDTAQAPEGYVRFLWAPVRTEEEVSKPFRESETFGNHRWPPILRGLQLFPDYSFPNATNGPDGKILMAPRYYVREIFIPEQNEGTRFIKREFMSHKKFSIPSWPVPEPTSVSYDILGAQGRFPECLHPRIVIPPTRTATAAYSVGDGNSGAAGAISGQIFPATNFEDRAPYFLSDQQTFQNGVWYRSQTQVFPPPELETIVR